jgi:hypothetical protein
MADEFFTIRAGSVTTSDWGDYGDMLQHGMAHRRTDGRLALERTGPYVPPITMPGIGDVVVTSDTRKLLEASGLTGFSFLSVEKVRIVELHWESWDSNAEEPAYLPESGEPEDYILKKPHSKKTAAAMGELWEFVVPPTVKIIRPARIVETHYDLKIDLSSWRGDDFFRSSDYGSMLFTKRAQEWLSKHLGQYVSFDSFPTT